MTDLVEDFRAVILREVLARKPSTVDTFCDCVAEHGDFFASKAATPAQKQAIKTVASLAIQRARRYGVTITAFHHGG